MKVFVKRLNACLQRRSNIKQYINYILKCGHEIAPTAEESDIILVWTCAFRKDYCNNSLAIITDYQRRFGEKRVVVCGCLPAIDEELLKSQFKGRYFKWRDDSKSLNAIFGNSNQDFQSTGRIIAEKNITNDIDHYRKVHPDEDVSYYDQFVKLFVSEGCLYDCVYCSEKLAFPDYKSFPLENMINQCQRLVEESHRNKVALIADSLGDYGKDFGSSLVELIDSVLGIRDDVKVGLMNLHPADFIAYFDYLVDRLREGKIFHLCIPVQSASDKILKLMNRPYAEDDLTRIFTELNRMNFRECETHLLIGFPSESHDDFQKSVDFMVKHKPKYVMASGYIESASMKSINLPEKVSPETIRQRIVFLAEQMKKHEIICNYDSCEYVEDKFRRQVSDITSDEKGREASLRIKDTRYQERSAFNKDIDKQYGELLKRHFDHPEHIIQNIHLYIKRYHLTRVLQFYELFKKTINVPGSIIELGVFRGASLLTLARMLEAFCMGDRTKKIYGFDHFKGLKNFSKENGAEYTYVDKRKGGWCGADYYDELKKLIELFDAERFMPLKERLVLIEGDVVETIPEFIKQNPGIRISLLHFDLDLYEPTVVGLKYLYDKVVPGGVVIFDEYGFPEFAGETRAVDEFFGDKKPRFKRFEWFSNPGAYFVKE